MEKCFSSWDFCNQRAGCQHASCIPQLTAFLQNTQSMFSAPLHPWRSEPCPKGVCKGDGQEHSGASRDYVFALGVDHTGRVVEAEDQQTTSPLSVLRGDTQELQGWWDGALCPLGYPVAVGPRGSPSLQATASAPERGAFIVVKVFVSPYTLLAEPDLAFTCQSHSHTVTQSHSQPRQERGTWENTHP